MIEKIILDWLGAKLDVSVYLEEPKNPPKEYVLIDKLGSAENDFITSATIAVQSYSASLYGAAEPVSYTHLRAHETPDHLVCRHQH